MASKEVSEQGRDTTKKMVEVWASAMDALLQELMAAGESNDKLAAGIATTKLALLGSMMMVYFKKLSGAFIESPTEQRAAREAAERLGNTVVKAMKAAGVGQGSSEQASQERDPSLN